MVLLFSSRYQQRSHGWVAAHYHVWLWICCCWFYSVKDAQSFSVHSGAASVVRVSRTTPRLLRKRCIHILTTAATNSLEREGWGPSSNHLNDSTTFTTNGYNRTDVLLDLSPLNPEENDTTAVIQEVNVLYGTRSKLIYDSRLQRYVRDTTDGASSTCSSSSSDTRSRTSWWFYRRWHNLLQTLTVTFVPAGVTSNYIQFAQWRFLQRFINANLSVFGTQALLLGLGISSTSKGELIAVSAALNWVLKDALGSIVRATWASKMSGLFDSDAKRWRFRSALLYAVGNGLELVAYLHSSWFLLWATFANCCKQICYLTNSSTRNAIYNSFRDGTRENLGDMTAKGEAQIAIVDLLGILSGVALCKATGTSPISLISMYVILQAAEIATVYQFLRIVQFRVLNFERLMRVIEYFGRASGNSIQLQQHRQKQPSRTVPTPLEMSESECVAFSPRLTNRRDLAFGSLRRAQSLSPTRLQELLSIFANERFLLIAGDKRRRTPFKSLLPIPVGRNELYQCFIVLHVDATNLDIVKSSLALHLLRQSLKKQQKEHNDSTARTSKSEPVSSETICTIEQIQLALQTANELMPQLLHQMTQNGWESPSNRLMFGRGVDVRVDWSSSS